MLLFLASYVRVIRTVLGHESEEDGVIVRIKIGAMLDGSVICNITCYRHFDICYSSSLLCKAGRNM